MNKPCEIYIANQKKLVLKNKIVSDVVHKSPSAKLFTTIWLLCDDISIQVIYEKQCISFNYDDKAINML